MTTDATGTQCEIATQTILGAAGTGKSTELRKRMADGARYLLTSTTGISAVNLGDGVTTINSALGFYDLKSLRLAAQRGQVRSKFVQFSRKGIKTVVIDEVSMLSAEALQLIHDGAMDAAEIVGRDKATGLMLVGDFCQLAPIPDRTPNGKPGIVSYAFEAPCWASYEAPENMTRLTKVWRQEDETFCKALSLVRAGRGVDGALDLKRAGVGLTAKEDPDFDGITLYAVNAQVDEFNARRLAALPGEYVTIPSHRWGREAPEWKNIPQSFVAKEGALVMCLINDGEFRFVNGDLATFHLFYDKPPEDGSTQWQSYIETKRGYSGPLPFVIRRNISFNEADENELYEKWMDASEYDNINVLDWRARHTMRGERYYDPKERGVVVGEVEYMPLRVAYASTVHKVQGLTLDRVQVNISSYWFSNPSMVYVALTRCRSIEGLRIVGDVGRLSRRIKTDSRVKRWV